MSVDDSKTLYARTPEVESVRVDQYGVLYMTVNGTEISAMNALRRVAIAEVPTMAIDMVEIEANNSVITDEMLAHRLGLVPLTADSTQFNFDYECDCHRRVEGCHKCMARFTLNVCCTEPDEIVDVFAESLQPVGDTKVVVTTPKILLARLKCLQNKNGSKIETTCKQEIRLKAIAKKGIGKEHAKWSPVVVAVPTPIAEITLNGQRLKEVKEAKEREARDYGVTTESYKDFLQNFCNVCPRQVLKCDKYNDTVVIDQDNGELDCIFCDECVQFGRDHNIPDLISVSSRPDAYGFTLETTGALSAVETMFQAIDVINNKLKLLLDAVDSLPKENGDDYMD